MSAKRIEIASHKVIPNSLKSIHDDKMPHNISNTDLIFDFLLSKLKGMEIGNGYRTILFWVFHMDSRVAGADKKTFELLDEFMYARDKKNVYWLENVVEGADRNTFTSIKINYGKDNHHVFRSDKIIDGADPASFQCLDGHYTKDNSSVYWYGEAIDLCDPSKFSIIDPDQYLSRDSAHVFWKKEIIKKADPKSIHCSEKYGRDYFEDKDSIFFQTKILQNVDKATLKINISPLKNYELFELYKIEVNENDPNDRVLDHHFAWDKKNVFFRGNILGERNDLVDDILAKSDITD